MTGTRRPGGTPPPDDVGGGAPARRVRHDDSVGAAGGTVRVLFVINGLGTGGAERSLAELLPRLEAGGIAPIVACLYPRTQGVERAVRARHDVRLLAGSNVATRARALRRLIRTERPNVVHTAIFEANLVGRLAAVGTPARLLTSLVNTTYVPAHRANPGITPAKWQVVKAVDTWTSRWLTDHFHAISQAVKDSAVRELGIPPQRITVIHRGRDPQRLGSPSGSRRRRARNTLGLADDAEVVVNVGRQEYQKGQQYLIEAVARLRHRERLVVLVAGRRGGVSHELQQTVTALDLDDRVRILGHRDDVVELLAAADVFVFPSLYEGLGGSVLEAMALGLPVVASDIPALREVLERDRNALLVAPRDVDGLANAIADLLDDRDRAHSFGQASREIFLERFGLAASARRFVDLYRALAGGVGTIT